MVMLSWQQFSDEEAALFNNDIEALAADMKSEFTGQVSLEGIGAILARMNRLQDTMDAALGRDAFADAMSKATRDLCSDDYR